MTKLKFTDGSEARPIQNGRLVTVRSDCEGVPKCIEMRVSAQGYTTEIEVHMSYADALWIRKALKNAVQVQEAADAAWARKMATP